MVESTIGVIGGTGLYQIANLTVHETLTVETPFGSPSDDLVIGDIEGRRVVFLPRHGKGHRLLPSEINYRANLMALKQLGVTRLISISAVGSMRERYRPTDVVLPDQFLDRTHQRPSTFFGAGLVAHVSLAEPVCPHLAAATEKALGEVGATCHRGGTYICIEGPQFSTRAESAIYRQWGVDVIGMTNVQEVKLAREAEMCYACIALVTDYDCWKEDEEAVSGESVMAVLGHNVEMAKQAVVALVRGLDDTSSWSCECQQALRSALITDFDDVPLATLEALDPIIGRYRREPS